MSKRGLRAVAALILLFAVLLALLALLRSFTASIGPASSGAVAVVAFLLVIAYFVLLFFCVPQCLLLRLLGVKERWAYLATGACSGWFFFFASFLNSDLARGHNGLERFIDVAGPWDFVWSGAFGLLFGWLWSLAIYRLPGDNARDWQHRVHGNNPGDLV